MKHVSIHLETFLPHVLPEGDRLGGQASALRVNQLPCFLTLKITV